MNSLNAPKETVKSYIDLVNMTKGLMDENQQSSVQQELDWGGGRGGESTELHRIGASESSASTMTDTNTSFAAPSTTERKIAEIQGSETWEDSQ